MPATPRVNALAERRQLLTLEADLHRNLIALEVGNLRAQVDELLAARQRVASSPWAMAGSAITGLLAFRHWRQLSRWAPMAITAVQWLRSWSKR